jgi:alcohol dehydrogenase (cytochrome c)
VPVSRWRFLWWSALGVAVLAVAAVVLAHPLRWRAQILIYKGTGQIDDIGWGDLLRMLRPGSDIYLERMAETKNPYLAIESPRHSQQDIETGKHLFAENCAACHGDEGHGGPGGPNLYDRVYRQGRSDWALYRTITSGIPNTAMVGKSLPRNDVWRLVSYLQHTIVEAKAERPDSAFTVPPVSANDIRAAGQHPGEWLTYSGSYSGQRHSRLREINRENVKQLRMEWQRQFSTSAIRVETTPIVRGTTMFVTEPPNGLQALDAGTGRVLWTYSRELPAKLLLCCGPVNRGVAILGDRVFLGTLDAHLIALDASTGAVTWDVAVGDSAEGYSITGAPLAIDNMVVTGVGGGEYGIRGFVDAYDAASGKRRWRFYSIPDQGQPGSESWERDSGQRGGAPTWLTGAFDPELRLIYWGIGNPSLNFYGDKRKGDNLFSNCAVALDAETGKLRWYFQFTPHDLHDWDAVQVPVLVDAELGGTKRKLLAWANRNAFYYLLDRETGKFLLGTPFAKQTWADGLDANGRPRVRPESIPTRQGSLVYPSLNGATNWWSPTYDPDLKLLYVPTLERGGIFYVWPYRAPDQVGARLGGYDTKVPHEGMTVAVKALDLLTGNVRWQYARTYSDPGRTAQNDVGGLLSTDGRLVFGADGETFLALDAESGSVLWHFDTGGSITAAPITYEQQGRQYIAVAAGRSILAFSLPSSVSLANPSSRGR